MSKYMAIVIIKNQFETDPELQKQIEEEEGYEPDEPTTCFDYVTKEDIQAAFAAGMCRLVHSYGNHRTETCLSLTGQDRDTRGETVAMYEAVWTAPVKSLQQCYALSRVE